MAWGTGTSAWCPPVFQTPSRTAGFPSALTTFFAQVVEMLWGDENPLESSSQTLAEDGSVRPAAWASLLS